VIWWIRRAHEPLEIERRQDDAAAAPIARPEPPPASESPGEVVPA
jgi:hypothetical protein